MLLSQRCSYRRSGGWSWVLAHLASSYTLRQSRTTSRTWCLAHFCCAALSFGVVLSSCFVKIFPFRGVLTSLWLLVHMILKPLSSFLPMSLTRSDLWGTLDPTPFCSVHYKHREPSQQLRGSATYSHPQLWKSAFSVFVDLRMGNISSEVWSLFTDRTCVDSVYCTLITWQVKQASFWYCAASLDTQFLNLCFFLSTK